ncbi:MAG: tyrosine-type recombinase/integrase [Xanthobacteraceae bacterium]
MAGLGCQRAAADADGADANFSSPLARWRSDALNRQIKHIGERAKLGFPVHIHMLRHARGYKLANDSHDTRPIQDYLGHKSIQHTVRYTELSPVRFKGFFAN